MLASHSRSGLARSIVLASLLIGAAILALALHHFRSSSTPTATAKSATTTANSTTARSLSATTRAAPADYMGVVLAEHPDFPSTQPLDLPVDTLNDAARLVFTDPIYLDNLGDLWIRRNDAPPVSALLKKPLLAGQTHLTHEHVVFAYRTIDADEKAQSQVVVEGDNGQFEVVNHDGRIAIGTPGRKYRWDRALWVARERESAIVVPTDTGIAMIRPQQRPIELFQELLDARPTTSQPSTAPATQPSFPEPMFALDPLGLIAWLPYDHDRFPAFAGAPAARFVDGHWTVLDESAGWPRRIVHLIARQDFGVWRLVANEQDDVHVDSAFLQSSNDAKIESSPIIALVAKLSDPDAKVRDEATDELARMGGGIATILQSLRDAQSPEGQSRIDQLLQNQSATSLGSINIAEGLVRVIARTTEGVALIYADAGIAIVNKTADAAAPSGPAWIIVNPSTIQPASTFFTPDIDPDHPRVSIIGNEWIVGNDALGPQRFVGNHFESLLRKSERSFSTVVGYDSRGRWLFRHTPDDGKTLILDPTLPDATPKLPVWQYPVVGGSVGWTAEGWPVIKSAAPWVIDESPTRPLDPKKEQMLTTLPPINAASPTTQSTTAIATSHPSTTQTTDIAVGPPIGVDADGGQYFDGVASLRYRPRGKADSSSDIVWTLPAEAVGGSSPVQTFSTAGHLFLFNQPGRIVRLRRTNDSNAPFKYEATFTKNIPNVDHPMRIWLDPAGRLVIAYDGDKLTILFPTGQIPTPVAQRMIEADLKANEPE